MYSEILCLSMFCMEETFHEKAEKGGTRLQTEAAECKMFTFSFRLRSIFGMQLVPFKMNSR